MKTCSLCGERPATTKVQTVVLCQQCKDKPMAPVMMRMHHYQIPPLPIRTNPLPRRSANKYKPGIPRITFSVLWNSENLGPAAAVTVEKDGREKKGFAELASISKAARRSKFEEKSVRRDWKGRIIYVPAFQGKMPICRGFYHHRWVGTTCRRCKATRKLKAV